MGQHSRSLNAQTAVQQVGLDKAELVLSPSSAQMSKSHHHGQAYYPPQDQQSASPHPVNQINSDNACHVLLHPGITNIQVEKFHTRHCSTTLPGPLPNWSPWASPPHCPSTCLTNYRRPGEAIGDVTCSLGRAPEPTAPTTFTPHYNPLYKPQRESALQPNRGRNDGNIRWLLPDPLIKKMKRKKMQTDPQLPLTHQAMTSENSCRASAWWNK